MHRLLSRPASRFCFSKLPNNLGRRKWSSFSVNDSAITITSLNASFPHIWLRDSCQSSTCVHPSTRQKFHRTSDIPLDIKPKPDGVSMSGNELVIDWTDGHRSAFSEEFLERHASPSKLLAFHQYISSKSWTPDHLTTEETLYLPYESLQHPDGLMKAITQLCERGLLFVTGVPNAETSDETCELNKLASYFGELRETMYGRVWDVRNVRNSINVAYTNLDLGLHMDLLHFEHPPRYQILHCLRNKVIGGSSIFVDALHCAELLEQESPSQFKLLTDTLVPFQYINNGHHTHYEHPTIQLESQPNFLAAQRIKHINYSPPFQAPLRVDTPLEFYAAFQRFTEILNDQRKTYTYLMKEGDAVLFDNRRVLHARTAFKDVVEDDSLPAGHTNRWLKGCYFEGDAMWDKARMLSKH